MATDKATVAKRTLQILALVGLFLVSFALFLFMTFPYEVLKESLAAELSQQSGYTIRIGDMSSSLPLGLKMENVRVETPTGSASLTLKSLKVGVSVLGFLLGKVATTVEATAGQAGDLEVGADFGIFDLIGGNSVPKRVTLESSAFPLDEVATFGLSVATSGPNANPMMAPLLSAIGVSGLLNGNMDFKLDAKNPTQSTGAMEITLAKAVLKLSHPSLGLPDQEFKKAMIKAKVENGAVVLDKNSGFVSDELELNMDGKVTLKPDALASLLDLKVVFKLNKGLKEKFGFLMDAMTGSATSEGQLTMQVRGPMQQPAVTTF